MQTVKNALHCDITVRYTCLEWLRALSSVQQTLVEQRRPLAANLRRSIAALREKEEKEQSSAPSYGSTVT